MEDLAVSDPRTMGPYRLVARLGSGGMGRVYLGISKTADQVAVKVIRPGLADDPELRARFESEVATLRRVYGSRVARFEGAGFDQDQPWLAVEYVPGRSLKEVVELRGQLGAEPAAMLGAMLAEGLTKIHADGLLHRDLKPQNVLLGPTGPKLIDFGLATLVDRREELTVPGTWVGTLAYMPPEQASGGELTAAADVYALGATVAYAATAKLLYGGLRGPALMNQLCDPTVDPDLSAVPVSLVGLIRSMLAHDPGDRPTLADITTTLNDLAVAGGRTAADLRAELAVLGHDETLDPDLPKTLATPQIDNEDLGTVDEDEPLEPEPVSRPEPKAAAGPGIDALVARLFERYDRRARL